MPGQGNSTPIIHGDCIFLTAAGGAERHVLCVRASDGKLLWQPCADRDVARERTHAWSGFASRSGKELYWGRIGRGNNSMASPISLRGKLLWLLDDDTTVVVSPGPKLAIAGRNKLEGSTLDFGASPAVANGKLYLRSQSYLYCIGEKK